MAWKKYSEMSPEDKKASWAKFSESSKRKKEIASRMRNNPPKHTSDHKEELNAGGYCKHCSFGRDHS